MQQIIEMLDASRCRRPSIAENWSRACAGGVVLAVAPSVRDVERGARLAPAEVGYLVGNRARWFWSTAARAAKAERGSDERTGGRNGGEGHTEAASGNQRMRDTRRREISCNHHSHSQRPHTPDLQHESIYVAGGKESNGTNTWGGGEVTFGRQRARKKQSYRDRRAENLNGRAVASELHMPSPAERSKYSPPDSGAHKKD